MFYANQACKHMSTRLAIRLSDFTYHVIYFSNVAPYEEKFAEIYPRQCQLIGSSNLAA